MYHTINVKLTQHCILHISKNDCCLDVGQLFVPCIVSMLSIACDAGPALPRHRVNIACMLCIHSRSDCGEKLDFIVY